MPRIKAPPSLPELVEAAFVTAKSNGDLSYYPTQVQAITPVPSPTTLLPLPGEQTQATTFLRPQPPFNPFANPSPALLITSLPHHNLVLNKFAIVPEHFIISTKYFKPQSHLLEPDDLEAAYACLEASPNLFVFFNSGPESGASQAHRHLQVLNVEKMKDGLVDGEWELLTDRLVGDEVKMPFWTVGEKIGGRTSGEELWGIYTRLYSHAVRKVCGDGEAKLTGKAMISYNLAMTGETMVLCPRLAEGGKSNDEEGKPVGILSLNGTVLAGTMLVKSQREWDVLRRDAKQVMEILARIGVDNREGEGQERADANI